MIPEDWEVKKLGEISNVKTGPFGSALHERDYVEDGTPIITVEHLGEQGVVHENLPMVSDSDKKRLAAYSLQPDDIVFSRVGSVDRNSLISKKENGWLFSGRLLRIRINEKNVYPAFLSYYFHSDPTKQRIRTVAVGQTMASLNTQILNNVQVTFPPTKAEQTAIAIVLSDADALIQSLEKLIAKKRNIKQGAMQKCLNCDSYDLYDEDDLKIQKKNQGNQKNHKNHSSDKWVVKKLGEVAVLKARIGWQGLTTAEYKETGDYFLITGTDFKNGFIDWGNCVYVDDQRYKQDKNIQVKENDVLVTKDGTIGKVAFIKNIPKPATLNSGVFVIRPTEQSFHPEFFYYLLLSEHFKIFLSQLSAGSTINHLYQKDFVHFEFQTPKTIEEQTRIATILSDMDAEIAALETKLTKYKQIKQGMMQELLTGRTRLI